MAGNSKSTRRARRSRLAVDVEPPKLARSEALDDDASSSATKTSGSLFDESMKRLDVENSVSKMILDTVSEGIYCLDLTGSTTFVNPAAATMLGWDPADLMGKAQHGIVHHSHADGTPYPLDFCPIYKSIKDGQPRHCDDEVFWRKDGTSFPVSYTTTALSISGVFSGTVVSFQDISERIREECWQRGKYSVFHGITMHLPVEETLQLLAEAYTNYARGRSIALLLRDEAAQKGLALISSSRLPHHLETQLAWVPIEIGSSACGEAAFFGVEVSVDPSHPNATAATYSDAPSVGRCVALPMISPGGQVRGVVAFFDAVERAKLSSVSQAADGAALKDLGHRFLSVCP